jgi:mercuric ion transport protein
MHDRTLITTGAVGALVAAICCATPLLAIVLGAVGLTAWMANADGVLVAAFMLGIALIGLGFCRRYLRAK